MKNRETISPRFSLKVHRVMSEIRHAFTKVGGNLKADGSIEVLTSPEDYSAVNSTLKAVNLDSINAETTLRADFD